ncbi:hypothetical protein KAU11_06110 [Candidatus Babeliales bacterium]|nr:hypothetical protein [Candidatus Babeliales bacterium]
MSEWERKRDAQRQKRAMLQKRKQEEERLTTEADALMERAKKSASRKKFEEAGQLYQNAAEIFKQLRWDQQAAMLEAEVKNMVTKKQEFEKSQRHYAEKQQKEKDIFDQRAQQILDEKEKKRREDEAARRKLSPVIQRKVDEAQFMIQKADKLAAKGKHKQAITRYQYVFEIYDTTNEITLDADTKKTIEEKITKLQTL